MRFFKVAQLAQPILIFQTIKLKAGLTKWISECRGHVWKVLSVTMVTDKKIF